MSNPVWERQIEQRLKNLESRAQLPSGYFAQKIIREQIAIVSVQVSELAKDTKSHMRFIWYLHTRIKKLEGN